MKKMFNLESTFTKLMMYFVDLILINLLFIIYSIPLFTIGASLTAMHTLTSRMVRGQHQYVFKSFHQAFKDNFKQGTQLWLLILLIGGILYANISFINYLSGIPYILFALFIFLVSIIFLVVLPFLFSTLARFENSTKNTLFNSLKLSLMNPLILVVLAIILYLPIILLFSSPIFLVTFIYIVTFGGFSFYSLIHSFVIQRVFSKYDR